MYFIHEQDDVAGSLHFVQHGFEALLELATIFSAGHDSAHVEADDPFVQQRQRGLLVGYVLGKAFHYRRFADTGISDKHRVVLLAAAKNLEDAFHFLLAADHRVELAAHGLGGEVDAVFVEGCGAFLLLLRGSLRLRFGGFRFSLGSLGSCDVPSHHIVAHALMGDAVAAQDRGYGVV